jgi:BlaI family transcriptional regulator, penicillinase repressor
MAINMKPNRFGQQQLKIMQLLWKQGEMSAREITDALREEVFAHSTVQTLLRQLEAKKAVNHRADGRTFKFFATVDEQIATQGAIRDFLSRLFEGSAAELAAHLVQNEKLSKEELRKLRSLIAKKEKQP